MSKLDISLFTELNRKRCDENFHLVNDWSPTDWGCALGGECGELLNFLKKMRRNEDGKITSLVTFEDIKKEVGDIFAYLNLLCIRLNINMEDAIIDKFNEVSDRVGSSIKYRE